MPPSASAREHDQPRVRDVALTTATLRIAEAGSGQPLLLINGIGAGFQTWWPFARLLSRSRRLIMLDAPGAGRSRPPRWPMRMPGLAGLLVELCDALGETQVDVLGYSWGRRARPGVCLPRPAARRPARPGLDLSGPGRPPALAGGAGAGLLAVAVPVQDVPDPHRAGDLRRRVAARWRSRAARVRPIPGVLAGPCRVLPAAVRDQLVDEPALAAPAHRADPGIQRRGGPPRPGAERPPAGQADPQRAARADTPRRPSVDARGSRRQRRPRRRIPLRVRTGLTWPSGRGRRGQAPGRAAGGRCCPAAPAQAPRPPSARWPSPPRPPTTSRGASWPT
jgi:pimeloyl-ACP methyl ester carboxylesterase